ncbi:LysR family transcriptional regulator [Exilibacterium tricleocarpae]|uniref:HTH-type transcriptional regulator MetR n=1 Tax=Exilibacterium tricleocarpae TaxID=2591008 RepID=A0A545SME8_9GAMM|nr:LysR family transcriptional regulator [Exilibacterium tricleocarpae]TQV66133.1 LysR family transcriptional regulator [Exilibacterium tricleocarpae]
MSHLLELRHLKTLAALRETGSLVDAAERVCLTQSALSHQIKELEGRIGASLFVRKSRPLRFTQAGKRLLSLADRVLALVADAERELNQLVHGEAGRLFMAIECHSCFNWLLPTIERFRGQWPAVELDFAGGFTFDPLPALAAEEVDLVITADPVALKSVVYLPLFSYEMQLALAADHRLAGRAFIEPQDLAEETLITYPVDRDRLDVFTRFLRPAAVEPRALRTAELTLMAVQLAASGRGVCALPNWVLEEYRAKALIAVKSAGATGVWPTLYAAVREESVTTAYVRDFLSQAREHCLAQLPGVRAPRGGAALAFDYWEN